MLNSTIVANINGSIPPGQKISSGLHSSLLMSDVEFAVTDVKTNTSSNEQQKYLQKIGGKGSPNVIFNGHSKGVNYLDSNRNPQCKPARVVNGNKNGVESADDEGPSPKICLYIGKISSDWQQHHKIGAGLVNLGNTCFMNTVLQCLTYCPPLINYLLHDSNHVSKCKITGFCMMCELQRHVKRVIDRPGDIVKPVHIYQKLKSIAKHFQFGRQEDAHEFLRYIIDDMRKSCIANYEGHAKLDPDSKETTVINKIFGGYHRSQVTCLRCKEKNNTYDHFMDFILDVKQNVQTLEKALEKFIQPELLQNENAYKCVHCKMKVSAQKKFSIYVPPNVATFQFKRFDYNRMCGGKITKHISYPDILNLRPYMSNPKGSPIWYRLNAVLVHLGATCNSGHYYCFVRNSNGFWYIMDDTRVQQVSLNQVLNQVAYVLFYVRTSPSENTSAKRPAESATSTFKNNQYVKNGFISSSSYSVSPNSLARPSLNLKSSALPAISKLTVSSSSQSAIPNHTSPSNMFQKRALQPLSQNREKVAFSIGPSKSPSTLPKTPAHHSQANSVPGSQGNTLKKESPLSEGLMNGNMLVPYIEDSSESSDEETKNVSDKCTKKSSPSTNLNGDISSADREIPLNNNNGHLKVLDTDKISTPCVPMDIKAKSRCSSNFLIEMSKYSNSTGNAGTIFRMKKPSCSGSIDSESHKTNCPLPLGFTSKRESTQRKENCNQGQKFCSLNENKTALNMDTVCESKNKLAGTVCNLNRLVEPNSCGSTTIKVNATTQWNVVDADVRSPSIASGSSTNSVSSTTEWKVIDKEPNLRGKSSKKSQTWARQVKAINKYPKEIKPIVDSKPQKSMNTLPDVIAPIKPSLAGSKLEKPSPSVKDGEVLCSLKDTDNPEPSVDVSKSGTKSSDLKSSSSVKKKSDDLNCEDSRNQIFLGQGQKPFQDQTFQAKPSHSFLESAQNNHGHPDSRRKSETKTPGSIKRCFSNAVENSCEERASRLSNHNENSHGTMPQELKTNDVSKSKRRKYSEVNSGKTPQHISNSTGSEKGLPDVVLSKTVNKETKHRGYDRTDEQRGDVSNSSSVGLSHSTGSHNKTWMEKSPTKHKNDRSYNLQNSQSQLKKQVACPESKKRIDSDSESVGRESCSSKSSFEYEWVEKTKETIETEKATTEAKSPSHNIFQHVPPNNSQSQDVASELQKHCHPVFGANVGTWDNSNRICNDNSTHNSRRYDYNEYDEEFDKGKVRRRKQQFRNEYRNYFSFQDGLSMKNRHRPPFSNKWQPRRFPYNHRNWGRPYGGQNQNGYGHRQFRKMYRNNQFHRR